MKKIFTPLILILAILAILIIGIIAWGVGEYNNFISLQADADEGWSQVEVQYQRRADLVPQLVATVEGAADFESTTLQNVTEARTNWLNTMADENATIDEQMEASSSFDSALSRLLVTVESYPTLTATESFQTLLSQLEGTENRISVARMDYNVVAKIYNVATKKVPQMLIANLFGFDEYPYFESDEGSEEAPVVEFDFE